MELLLTYAERIRTMKLSRMQMYIREIHAESGRASALIFLDMVWCFVRYGTGYLEYRTFGFVYQNSARRRTYMTMRDNHRLCRTLNGGGKRETLENKVEFLQAYQPLIGRDWIDLASAGREGFAAFIRCNPVFFAKTPAGFGGRGVERVVAGYEKPDALYERLMREGKTLAEQPIAQHAGMAALCPRSVNTLRIATIVKDGEVHVMYVILRIGNGRGDVDNITSGGMYAPVGPDGIVRAAAFCDKTGQYYEQHPVTRTRIEDFAVPMYDEAVALARRAALIQPGVRYVGWDVAITPDGPVLVEGNTLPGFYIRQNYRHLGAEKNGAKPDFVAVLGAEF